MSQPGREPGEGASPVVGSGRDAGWRRVLGNPVALVAVWVISRSLMLHDWYTTRLRPIGDPNHYFFAMHHDGIRRALPEYPVWVVWMMAPLRAMAGDSRTHFALFFAVLMTLVDIVATALLWRYAGRRAAWYWMLFGAALGAPLLWFRFDIITGMLVAGALVERGRHPGLAGACVAVGAAIKLWPVLLVATLWRRGRAGWRFLAGMVLTGAVLVGAAVAADGWSRLTSPLRWQADRGLQIESIVATPLMLERAVGDTSRWPIRLSKYLAYEIFGPGVPLLLRITSVLTGVLGLLVLAVLVQSWRRREVGPSAADVEVVGQLHDMTMATLAIIGMFMLANKTFSPQYLFWIAGPLAVLVALRLRATRMRAIVLVVLGLSTAVLTQVIFPHHYALIHSEHPVIGYVMVLAVRNLLLVLLVVLAVVWAFARPRRARDADADDRSRSGRG